MPARSPAWKERALKAEERLAVLTALQKTVKERLDEARAEVAGRMLEAWREDGVAKKALRLGGVKVGDLVVSVAPGSWEVSDQGAFEAFALDYGLARVERGLRPEWRQAAFDVLERELPEALEETVAVGGDWRRAMTAVDGAPCYLDSGMAVPGIRWEPERARCVQVRGCRPEDVAPVLRALGRGVDELLSDGTPAVKGRSAED